MKPTLSGLLAALALLGVVACNTVEGAGKDIQSGGEAVSDTAATTKQRL